MGAVAGPMSREAVLRFRAAKDRFFAESDQSPLPPEVRATFVGLAYFDHDPRFDLHLTLEAGDGSRVVVVTSDGDKRLYRRAAKVRVEVDGEVGELTLFDTGHHGLFLPFRDATSGTETYGAGRYLDLEPNPDGSVDVDFNLAYNPTCAYDEAYSCPLPPLENWLAFPIRAGEKALPG